VPLYLFRCTGCGTETEQLLALGELADRECADCGSAAKHRFARVAVKYNTWGFGATDNLVTNNRGKDFTALREAAEKISDS
jgi:putative FmdB family regulatory protein